MTHLPRTLLLFLALLFLPCARSAAQPGQTLIPFKGTGLDGQPYDLQQSIGKQPVMLIFWASWCPTCRTEVPRVNKLAEKYRPQGMEFVAINVGFNDSLERAQAFVRSTGMTYPVYFDGSSTITESYRIQGVPTIIIADKQGVIRYRQFTAPDLTEAGFTELMVE